MSHVRSWYYQAKKLSSSPAKGFTLVEMLVVAPIAIIAISVLISTMVAMVGDSIASFGSASNSYAAQTGLDRIEQDTKLSSAFLSNLSLLEQGQGRSASTTNMTDTTPFASSNGDLILYQSATSTNPYSASRSIVYYKDQPNACGANAFVNRVLMNKIVYFTTVKTVTPATYTLWRRTIVPSWNLASNNTQTVCDTPWQRDSCPLVSGANCLAADEKILDNVTNYQVTYYDINGAVTTDPKVAKSIKVQVAVDQKIAGKNMITTAAISASRANDALTIMADQLPAAPSVSIRNATDNTYNNPILTTVGWNAVTAAESYSITYTLVRNGTPINKSATTTGTSFAIGTRPNDQLTFNVKAVNSAGESSVTTFTYTVPVWTNANLINGWSCFSGTTCPSYTITGGDVVVMRGLAKNTSAGSNSVIFNVPSSLTTNKFISFPAQTAGAIGRIDITGVSNGVRRGYGSGDAQISLDNVRYLPSSFVTSGWSNMTLYSDWYIDGDSWGDAQWTLDSKGRVHTYAKLSKNDTLDDYEWMGTFSSSNAPTNADMWNTVTYDGTSNSYGTFEVDSSSAIKYRQSGIANPVSAFSIYGITQQASTSFTNLTLTNGWVHPGWGYNAPSYYKGSDGLVILRGLMNAGTAPTSGTPSITIATLPAGYCPSKEQVFITQGSDTSGNYRPAYFKVSAWASGPNNCTLSLNYNATYPAGSGGLQSLAGISYYAEY